MFATHENYGTGYIGLSIAFSRKEIPLLIKQFEALERGDLGHFHFRRNDFSPIEGIADVEISLMADHEVSNMHVE